MALDPQPNVGSGKALASVCAGAITVIVIYIITRVLGSPLPAEVSGAIQILITSGAVWIVPSGSSS